MKEITATELKALMDSGADIQIVDVREPAEFAAANIKGELIPLGTIPQNIDKISKDKQVIIHCRSGKRSANAISYLENNFGFENLYNLEGGIIAWSRDVDTDMEVQ